MKVLHPILISLAISAAIIAITVAIYYMADSGMFSDKIAEAMKKEKGRKSDIGIPDFP